MIRAVLADTGPLYAAADPSDQYHNRAQDELRRLQRQRALVLVAYPTLWTFDRHFTLMRAALWS